MLQYVDAGTAICAHQIPILVLFSRFILFIVKRIYTREYCWKSFVTNIILLYDEVLFIADRQV